MTTAQLVIRYALFAVIATVCNLGAQRGVLLVVPAPTGLAPAMIVGTGAGLVVKYLLDKRWIFYDLETGIATHSRQFTLYTLMGVLTTLVFWGSETAFWLTWKTDLMREIGAVIGLMIGYVIKYNLDRRFVFTSARAFRSNPADGGS